tara:strand:+ start:714 stop:1550 length:837 start_codon:yes stop_codon:yes gene_type:complete
MENFFDLIFNNNCDIDGGLRRKKIFKKSLKNKPLISIITVVYNNETYLQECFDSVHNQNFQNFEHIVIDGGSTDETLNIVKENTNKIDYWCSKKDRGIYDAFNIGMTLARGDIICFVNSDDKFYSEKTLDYAIEAFKNNKIDFLFGPVKKHWAVLSGYKPWKIHFSWGFYTSHSTGFFIKRESAKKVGFYNLKYKYSSDYDYFYRMIVKHKLKGVGINKNNIFGIFRRGGYSSTIRFIDHFKEEIQIRIDNKQNKLLILIIIIYKSLKNISRILKDLK